MYNIFVKTEPSVAAVTDQYLHIIGDALTSLGHTVRYSDTWQRCDLGVTATATGAARFALQGRPYLFWAQGVWPEESYLRNASRLRLTLTGALERFALKHARFCFFVSQAQRAHYEKKYGLSFEDRCYIMPCCNEQFHPETFTEEKYAAPTFCYLGSTSVWQCFEETIALFARIQSHLPDARLLLLVKDRDKAQQLLERYGVRNWEIDYVPIDRLPRRLAEVHFGFLLRRDHIVNRVASPTKLTSYISNGVIPIYSGCIESAAKILSDTPYAICYHETDDLSALAEKLTVSTDAQEVRGSYAKIFERHYDSGSHTRRIAALLKTRLE